MICRYFSFILYISLLYPLYSYPIQPPGDTLCESVDSGSMVISFSGNDEDLKYNNFILQEISLFRQQKLEDVSLGYTYNRKVSLTRQEGNNFKLSYRFSGMKLPDVHYREINLSDVLMPSGLDSEVDLYDSSGLLVKKLNVRSLSLIDNGMGIDLYFFMNEPVLMDSLSVWSQLWYFSEAGYERFTDRLGEINSYYAAARLCIQLADRLSDMEPLMESEIVESAIVNIETTRAIHSMENNDVFMYLAKRADDPAGFLSSLEGLKRALTRSNTLLAAILSRDNIKPGDLLFSGPAAWSHLLEWYYLMAAQEPYEFHHYYENMTLLRPETRHVFRETVATLFSQGMPVDTEEGFWEAMFIDLLEKALAHTDIQDFAKGRIFVENARQICGWMEGLECWNRADSLESYIDKTMSDMYLGMLQRALERDNISLALDYLNKLEDVNGEGTYREFMSEKGGQIYFEYLKNYIADSLAYYDQELPALMPEIEHKIIRNGFGDYRDSVILLYHRLKQSNLQNYYENIKSLCEDGRPLNADLLLTNMERDRGMILSAADTLIESAERMIAAARREYFVEMGNVYLNYNRNTRALRAFYLAKSIPAASENVTYDSLQHLMRLAAMPIMDSSFESLKACVEFGDYSCVKRVMRKAEQCIDDYGFRDDPEMMARLDEWHLFVERNKCSFLSKDIERKKRELDRLMEEKEYFKAEELALIIQTMADQYGYCGIPVKEVRQLFKLLCPATVYLTTRDSLESITDPREYIIRHQELDRFYDGSGIDALGIEHRRIGDKLLENKDPQWLTELFGYFMGEDNPDAAFLVMKSMRSAGMKPVNLMNEQIELGKLLARHHISEDDARNPYLLINDYTLNDKWYSFLRKYYLAAWEEHMEE